MVTVATGPDHLVIRQLYPGGGNSGATYNRDFVELFNPSNGTISLSGKSLQYASATGTTWSVAALPATASIPPGGSYLVQLQGGTTGVALPTPDFSSSAINMGAAAGKLAFVDDTAALSGACPTDNIIDIVGWGTSTTTCSEGDVAPPPSPNTKSLSRAMNGCTDADDNSMDFAVVDVTPRNSATTPTPCL
jgi:predicted extracellular nuclease